MNAVDAAYAWQRFIEPFRTQGARLGSPAIASTEDGLNWMKQFLQQLNQ